MQLVTKMRADGREYFPTPKGATLKEWAELDTGNTEENLRRHMVYRIFCEQNTELDGTIIRAFSHIECRWRCDVCGHIWINRLDHVTDAKRWCGSPVCNKHNTSVGEQLVYRILKYNFKDAELHYCLPKPDGLEIHNGCFDYEYDIYVPSLNLLVEYNGESVHSEEDTMYRDSQKRYTASHNGYKLLTIVEKSCNRDTALPCEIEFNGNSNNGYSDLSEKLQQYILQKYNIKIDTNITAEDRLSCYLGKFDGNRDEIRQAVIYLNDGFSKDFVSKRLGMSATEVNRIHKYFRKFKLIKR